jgi:hypothetical protein
VIAAFDIALYLVLRPLTLAAPKFRAMRSIIDADEHAVFDAVGVEPPSGPRADFVAKAATVVPLILFALLEWNIFVTTGPGLYLRSHEVSGSARPITYDTVVRNGLDGTLAVALASSSSCG